MDKGVYGFDGTGMSWRCEGCGGTGEYLVTHPYDPDMNHYAECAFFEGNSYYPNIS